jgi:hypothetical protein
MFHHEFSTLLLLVGHQNDLYDPGNGIDGNIPAMDGSQVSGLVDGNAAGVEEDGVVYLTNKLITIS